MGFPMTNPALPRKLSDIRPSGRSPSGGHIFRARRGEREIVVTVPPRSCDGCGEYVTECACRGGR